MPPPPTSSWSLKIFPSTPTAPPHAFTDKGIHPRRRHPIPITKTVLRELLRFSEGKLIDFFHRLGNDAIIRASEKLPPHTTVDCDKLKGRGGPATFQRRRSRIRRFRISGLNSGDKTVQDVELSQGIQKNIVIL